MLRIFIWIIMILGGSIMGYYLDYLIFPKIPNNIFFHIISLFIGVFLFFIMIKISKNTGRILAKYGRKGELERMQTNIFVNQQIYSYMRHPMHLGLFLFPFATAFLIGSLSFIIIIAPIEIVFMLIMIKLIEEPEAIKKFGNEYIKYKNKVPWFCFKIKCLKELLKNIPENYTE